MFDEDEEWAEGHGDDGEAEELPCPECGAPRSHRPSVVPYLGFVGNRPTLSPRCPDCGAFVDPRTGDGRFFSLYATPSEAEHRGQPTRAALMSLTEAQAAIDAGRLSADPYSVRPGKAFGICG